MSREERITCDDKLSLLPHDPEHLAHMVQLHLKIGTLDMAKHIKEIKVRAHVVLALGYDLIRAGHAAYIKSNESGKLKDVSSRMRAAQAALKRRVQQRYPTLGTPEDSCTSGSASQDRRSSSHAKKEHHADAEQTCNTC